MKKFKQYVKFWFFVPGLCALAGGVMMVIDNHYYSNDSTAHPLSTFLGYTGAFLFGSFLLLGFVKVCINIFGSLFIKKN